MDKKTTDSGMKLPEDRHGFLCWIARIILTGYYEEHNETTGNDETYTEEEVAALVKLAEEWLDNESPEATERELVDFMFDNRRT